MKILLILLLAAPVAYSQFGGFGVKVPIFGKVDGGLLSQSAQRAYSSFQGSFGKAYDILDEATRKVNFQKNFDIVNNLKDVGLTFAVELNKFAVLSLEQFSKFLNGYSSKANAERKNDSPPLPFEMKYDDSLPKNVDWRERGAVNKVKDQKLCACCYAFSAAGALEAQHFKKAHKLQELSVQNVIDCSNSYGNLGCSTGYIVGAFDYAKSDGLAFEQSYPYLGKNSSCISSHGNKIHCKGFVYIPENDEKALERAIAKIGPVAAAINANLETFQFYKNGIYDDPQCDPNTLSHAILIVGYGEEPNGKKYWIVKNSYGSDWGEQGYVRIARGVNRCGIAAEASYPVV